MQQSALNTQNSARMEGLFQFARRLVEGEPGGPVVAEYRALTDTVTPVEAMQVFDALLVHGYPVEQVKDCVGKIINMFHHSLRSFPWEPPGEGHFLYYLMQENRAVEQVMAGLKEAVRTLYGRGNSNVPEPLERIREGVARLREYERHYIKKENILFPLIEKAYPQYRCLQLMWAFHDDFRNILKRLDGILGSGEPDLSQLNVALGKLFFVVLPVVFREERIVFPVALQALPAHTWDEMLAQSFEIGWCYGVAPLMTGKSPDIRSVGNLPGRIQLGTGSLAPDQLILMLNALPVDIPYVDEYAEVRYFSAGAHRIFPRSVAIIGRKVQNCHPPGSVHIVEAILEAFRTGQQNHADFWIQSRGRFLHIRYFALRDDHGAYRGTLEVSQDVTEIRQLEGGATLLDWDDPQ
jgi:DUF438 domain-containing protein